MMSCATDMRSRDLSKTYLSLGNSLYKVGNNAEAIKAYETAFSYDPENFHVLYNLTLLNLQKKDYMQADYYWNLLDGFMVSNNKSGLKDVQIRDFYLLSALIYQLKGDYQNSKEIYNELLGVHSNVLLVYEAIIESAIIADDFSYVIDIIKLAMAKGLATSEMYILAGDISKKLDDHQYYSWYRIALLENSEFVPALRRMAEYSAYVKDFKSQIEFEKRICILEDTKGDLWFALGKLQLQEDDSSWLDSFQKALDYGYYKLDEWYVLYASLQNEAKLIQLKNILEKKKIFFPENY